MDSTASPALVRDTVRVWASAVARSMKGYGKRPLQGKQSKERERGSGKRKEEGEEEASTRPDGPHDPVRAPPEGMVRARVWDIEHSELQ